MSFVSYTIIYRIFWFFHKAGVAGLACKQVIYNVLPEEVLRYGEEHSFPIFLIEEGSWFENIIFEIMTAVEQDEARYLSEDLLRNMVHGTAAAGDIDTAAAALHCHANTVRYRLARMKELLGSPDRTDHELFRDLAVAYMVWMMEE